MDNYYEIHVYGTSTDVTYSEFNVLFFLPTQCRNRQDYRKCNAVWNAKAEVRRHREPMFPASENGASPKHLDNRSTVRQTV